ncbi:MAG: DUF4399 domain-containing protein [Pseudomonadota bacterium]
MRKLITALALFAMASGVSIAGETPSRPGAQVYFINLNDGDTVKGPVKVQFGLSGMGVAPAGVEQEGTGHHHLFVNRPAFLEGDLGAGEADEVIPADDNHRHFGGGQTETTLELGPGQHTLQMVLGDHNHIPHDPPVVSEVITITVE